MKNLDSIETLKKNWKNTFHKQFDEVELDRKVIDSVQDIEDIDAEIWYFEDIIDDEEEDIVFSKTEEE